MRRLDLCQISGVGLIWSVPIQCQCTNWIPIDCQSNSYCNPIYYKSSANWPTISLLFDTLLFWLGIWEQGRVEFDSGVFPYTQPEQPRVEFCLIVLRIEENIMPIDIQFDVNTNRYPTLCHFSFKFILIVIKCTTNRVPIDKQLSWTNPV